MTGAPASPLAEDLDRIADRAHDALIALRGAHVYVTGGTGFVGTWLVESFLHANERLALGARMTVLTRDPQRFAEREPHLAGNTALTLLAGDVRRATPNLDGVTHVIHGATAASASLNATSPMEMFDTIVDGTRRTMDAAGAARARRILVLSSGAVYGAQPRDLPLVDETYQGGPDVLDPANAYAEGKRAAEMIARVQGRSYGSDVVIARLFAFVGPHLPLDTHFAIGNFIGDALARRDIRLSGDGSPHRSYLYAADLASWLWVLLVRGANGRAYNVGSEHSMALWDVAHLVSATLQEHGAGVPQRASEPDPTMLPSRYVPSTGRARAELGLEAWTPLDQAIRRTWSWHSGRTSVSG